MMTTITFFHIAGIGLCALFMCSTQAAEPDSSSCCPTFWTSFGKSCYRIMANPKTWEDAEANCQQLGSEVNGMDGHLVSIHNREENNFVQKYYESSVLVLDRKAAKFSNNALWLGLIRKDTEVDTFTWSDDSEVSASFWKNTDNRQHNCARMLTSSRQLESQGKWQDASCTKKSPFMCKLVPVSSQQDNDIYSDQSYSFSSSAGLLPCSYRGNIILHGETMIIDKCTTCRCDNSTVRCDIRSCPPTFCKTPYTLQDECCEVCPYDVPVYHVDLQRVKSVKAGRVNEIRVDLQVSVNENGQDVSGDDLWRVEMWASASADGTGKKIGFTEQVLTDGQASQQVTRPPIFGGFYFSISDINFRLDASDTSCEELQYVCASFNIGDTPQPRVGSHAVPLNKFNVYGVQAERDSTPNPSKLIGCQPFTKCKGKSSSVTNSLPCSYNGNILLHGESLKVDACTSCSCNNSTVRCQIRSCQPTFCSEPYILEDECCDVCPFDVPVYGVDIHGVKSVKAGTVNDIRVDLQVAINERGEGARGNGLWKVGMWASAYANGRGKKIGFMDQVLTNDQSSMQITRPPIFGGFDFSIPDINFLLDTSDASCEELQYVCASFNMSDTPEPRLGSHAVPLNKFNVYGVQAERNSTPNADKLTGCQPFANCKG